MDGTAVATVVGRVIGMDLRHKERLSAGVATVVDRVASGTDDMIVKWYRSHWGGLPATDLVRKNTLVADQIAPAFDIRVPRVLAALDADGFVGLVLEDAGPTGRADPERAALYARRLHNAHHISPELRSLMDRTRPNRLRVLRGVRTMAESFRSQGGRVPPWIEQLAAEREPSPEQAVAIHGDYHQRNLASSGGDVVVLDWDLLGWGDPMWDLAYLVAAARATDADKHRAFAGYGRLTPAERARLTWHLSSWSAFWWLDAATSEAPEAARVPGDPIERDALPPPPCAE